MHIRIVKKVQSWLFPSKKISYHYSGTWHVP